MSQRAWRIALAFVSIIPSTILAQGIEPVVLDSLLAEAMRGNPQIRSAERRSFAAQHRDAQVSVLQDPMFAYFRWISTPETRVGPQENVFMLSQSIPFPGKLGLRGDVANEDAVAAGEQYEAVRRDIMFNVKKEYYNLYWIDRSLTILEAYLALLKDFSRVAEQKYATGEGIQANVFKSQVEISTIIERKLAFESLREGVVARVNALLNRPSGSQLGMATELDTMRVEAPDSLLVERALERRQELRASEAMIRKAEFKKDLADIEYYPNLNLQATYITVARGSSAAPDAGKDAYGVGLGLNIPIQLGRRVAASEEAEATYEASKLAHRNLENTVRAEIADLRFQLDNSRRTLELYDKGLLVQAESALESALYAYRTGKLDFLSLLDSERMLLQARLGYVTEQSSYQKIVAALERSVGGELPRQ
ncbi:MAG: TolC family protein [Bacteroidetes bacterium]|nr:TolC family protein [Bacteroidota bacterium]